MFGHISVAWLWVKKWKRFKRHFYCVHCYVEGHLVWPGARFRSDLLALYTQITNGATNDCRSQIGDKFACPTGLSHAHAWIGSTALVLISETCQNERWGNYLMLQIKALQAANLVKRAPETHFALSSAPPAWLLVLADIKKFILKNFEVATKDYSKIITRPTCMLKALWGCTLAQRCFELNANDNTLILFYC